MELELGSSEVTEAVIGAAFEVANSLGPGFLEKVDERALVQEFGLRGIKAKAQAPFRVLYQGRCVGDYIADVVVEVEVIVELKCVECFSNDDLAQCIHYLKASGLRVALLINLQRVKVEWRRVLLDAVGISVANATLKAMTQPQGPKIQLVNTAEYRENYANSVQVRVNLWDFFLMFGRVNQTAADNVVIQNFQGVYVSPQQAKALLNVLQQNVSQYEAAFGQITLDPSAGNALVQ